MACSGMLRFALAAHVVCSSHGFFQKSSASADVRRHVALLARSGGQNQGDNSSATAPSMANATAPKVAAGADVNRTAPVQPSAVAAAVPVVNKIVPRFDSAAVVHSTVPQQSAQVRATNSVASQPPAAAAVSSKTVTAAPAAEAGSNGSTQAKAPETAKNKNAPKQSSQAATNNSASERATMASATGAGETAPPSTAVPANSNVAPQPTSASSNIIANLPYSVPAAAGNVGSHSAAGGAAGGSDNEQTVSNTSGSTAANTTANGSQILPEVATRGARQSEAADQRVPVSRTDPSVDRSDAAAPEHQVPAVAESDPLQESEEVITDVAPNATATAAPYTYSSSYDHEGTRGNPVLWTIVVVYGGLSLLAIILYLVWADSAPRRSAKRKMEMSTPGSYPSMVL